MEQDMAREEWIMVRLRLATKARLDAEIARVSAGRVRAKLTLSGGQVQWTADRVIARLLDKVEGHQARSRKSAENRKSRKGGKDAQVEGEQLPADAQVEGDAQ
jgi:hypothetical protein